MRCGGKIALLSLLALGLAFPARADMIDFITGSLWSEACAEPGTREADRWVALSRAEWCEEFVGDFGRVHSMCRPVNWTYAETNRFQVLFTDDHVMQNVEVVAPNRLSVFSIDDGKYVQETVLGRARVNPNIETLHVECR